MNELKFALQSGNLALVKQHIESNNDKLNIRFPDGETPLHWAAYSSIDVIKYLLEKGYYTNSNNWHQTTPLTYAVIRGAPQHVIEFLLENGADPINATKSGILLHDLPICQDRPDVKRILRNSYEKQLNTRNDLKCISQPNTNHSITQLPWIGYDVFPRLK